MMQEYPKLLSKYQREYGVNDEQKSSDNNGFNVGMTCFPPWLAMKPVKSNIADSIKQCKKMGTSFSAAHGEAAVYYMNRTFLRAATNENVVLESKEKREFTKGIPVDY